MLTAILKATLAAVVALGGLAPDERPPTPNQTTDPSAASWWPAGDAYLPPTEPAVTVWYPADPLEGLPQWHIDAMDIVAQCESGGRWDLYLPGRTFQAGLQWHADTWEGARFKGLADDPSTIEDEAAIHPADPVHAWEATREQQIRAAWVTSSGGKHYGAWPNCRHDANLPK